MPSDLVASGFSADAVGEVRQRLDAVRASGVRILFAIESGSRAYRRTRSGGGYDFQSLICQNPCITCIAVNMLINCCCGRAFWC